MWGVPFPIHKSNFIQLNLLRKKSFMARNFYDIFKDTCIFVNIWDDFVLTLKMFAHT